MTVVDNTIGRARRVIVITIIVSFSIAALAGIVVLLGGSGEILARVVGTTAAVGAASIVALCGTTLFGRRGFPLGVATVVIAIIALAFTLTFIWFWDAVTAEFIWDAWTSSAILAAAFGILSLLVPLMLRVRRVVHLTTRITGVLVLLIVIGLIIPLWAGDGFGEVYWRTLAVIGVIGVLGVVVSPVLGMLQPDSDARALSTTRVSAELITRIEESAAARGITVEQLLAPVLAPRPHSAHPQTQPIAPRPHR